MKCAIVLAAGRSTRMGAHKVLLPLGDGATTGSAARGSTVIERIVRELARSAIDRILVVVGHEAGRVEEALRMAVGHGTARDPDVRRGGKVALVRNPDPRGDMLSSVRCGLRALPEACDAVLVALGDQPRIAAGVVDTFLRAFDVGRKGLGGDAEGTVAPRGIIVPVHRGKRGHPILLAATYRAEILERHDGVGLRGLLAAHPEDVLELEVPDAWVLSDMDRPEDYERERRETGATSKVAVTRAEVEGGHP